MFSHVSVGTADMARAVGFYTPVMAALGLAPKFGGAGDDAAGWVLPGATRPIFVLCTPLDGRAARAGNGAMVAFLAPGRVAVDAAHTCALAAGGACEGPPGVRPEYHADFYGAYVRDLDGNKLCFCNHEPA